MNPAPETVAIVGSGNPELMKALESVAGAAGAVAVVDGNHDSLPTPPDKPSEPEQPKLTRRQIGELRRKYITVQNPIVIVCGHKFTNQVPRTNCAHCWEAYFGTSEGHVTVAVAALRSLGDKALIAERGEKYVKRLKRFLDDRGIQWR